MAFVLPFLCGGALTYGLSSYWNSRKHAPAAAAAEGTVAHESSSTSVFGGSPDAGTTTSDVSQVNFFTDLLKALWPELDVAVSKMIRASCEEIFATLTPKIIVQKMHLGTVPMRMENIIVSRQGNSVRVTLDCLWNGNCDMKFKAVHLGVGFGVEHLKFHGRLVCMLYPLTQELPLIGAVQYAFVNPPKLQMKFTGLASIADTSMLQTTVQDTIASSLTSLVLPNQSLYKMDPKLTVKQIYQAPLGVLRLTVMSGSGFKDEIRSMAKNDVPDVYVKVQLGGGAGSRTHTTSVVKDSLTPVWTDETCDFALYDKDQILQLEAWDQDSGTLDSDDALGSAQVTIQDILHGMRNGSYTVHLQTADYRSTGSSLQISCALLPLVDEVGRIELETKSSHFSGLLTVLIASVSNLPTTLEKASSYVKVQLGKTNEKVTATVVDSPGLDALNPVYDATFEYPLTFDLMGQDITLELWNGTAKDAKLIGSTTIAWKTIVDQSQLHLTKQPISGNCTMDVSVLLKAVAAPITTTTKPIMASVPALPDERKTATQPDVEAPPFSSGGQSEVLTITAIGGRGFPVERRRLKKSDIPDVYLQITVGTNPTVWRTPTCKDRVDPVWNVSHDFAVSSGLLVTSQSITIQSFDEDSGKRDSNDPMGQARVNVGHILTNVGSTLEIELLDETNGQPLGRYVTLACQLRTSV